MANNRMSLKCNVCDEAFLLAKYYPTITDGWFVKSYGQPDDPDAEYATVHALDAFLQNHSYCDTEGAPSMDGNRQFSLVFEVP